MRAQNLSFLSRLPSQVLKVLNGSLGWFDLLDSIGLFRTSLENGNDNVIDQTIWFFRSIQGQRADRIAELLEPHLGASDLWNQRLLFLTSWSRLGAGRRFFELFLRMIDEGILDELRGPVAVNSEFWSVVSPLETAKPDWACELIAHYCYRRLALTVSAGSSNPFDSSPGIDPHSQEGVTVVLKVLTEHPPNLLKRSYPSF